MILQKLLQACRLSTAGYVKTATGKRPAAARTKQSNRR
jgi:deoxyribose-phosphate aldolase